jgi:pyrroloquinoline-quinone synthase
MLKLVEGTLTVEQLKVSAIQFYFHTVGFTNALAHLVARCKVPKMRMGIAEGLYEEETGAITKSKPHLELFYGYLQCWGIDREFVQTRAFMLPGTTALINWYLYSTLQLDPLVGIAVLTVAAEGQNVSLPESPGASALMAKGLMRHYGKTEEDVAFFIIHDAADQEHSTAGIRLLTQFVQTEEQKEMVRAAIRMTQDAFWEFIGGPLRYTWEDSTRHNAAMFY